MPSLYYDDVDFVWLDNTETHFQWAACVWRVFIQPAEKLSSREAWFGGCRLYSMPITAHLEYLSKSQF